MERRLFGIEILKFDNYKMTLDLMIETWNSVR